MFSALLVFLAAFGGYMIVKWLKIIGVTVFTYIGMDIAIQAIIASIKTQFGGLTADGLIMLSLMGVDHSITIILSAYAAALAFKASVGMSGS